MIVRISRGEQYEVAADLEDRVFSLDVALDAAIGSGSEERFHEALGALVELIRSEGTKLDSEELLPADIVLPQPGTTLQEYRILLDSEAFEC